GMSGTRSRLRRWRFLLEASWEFLLQNGIACALYWSKNSIAFRSNSTIGGGQPSAAARALPECHGALPGLSKPLCGDKSPETGHEFDLKNERTCNGKEYDLPLVR